ncbi:AEC family transporter [Candidatus Fermentibacteria bacterium]|nr:AEC family transporter [Candidatus Fermentibacteria bacterium]
MAAFLPAFWGTFTAILDIFLVVAAAGVLVRTNVVTQAHVTGLTAATVNVFLPALIFSNLVTMFDPDALSFWWVLPLSAVAITAIGLGLAAVAFGRRLSSSRNLLPLVGLQNAGYLVLPVGLRLFPDQFETFALYTFLFIIGVNPLLWSLGPLLATNRSQGKRGWRGLMTPPLVASLVGIAGAMVGCERWMPSVVLNAVSLMGQATVPVATFALGAILGGVPCCLRDHGRDALQVSALKLTALPAIVMVVLRGIGLAQQHELLAQFFVIQAASAPATGIILQVRTYGGDERKIGSIMLVTYALCSLTLPLCLTVWRLVSN